MCRLSELSECGVNDTWLSADAEFAVRLFGNGLLYGSHQGRYFHFQTTYACSSDWQGVVTRKQLIQVLELMSDVPILACKHWPMLLFELCAFAVLYCTQE